MSYVCQRCASSIFEIVAGTLICQDCGEHDTTYCELSEDEESILESKKKFYTALKFSKKNIKEEKGNFN